MTRSRKTYLHSLENLHERRRQTARKLFDVIDSNSRPVNYISSGDGFGILGTKLKQKKVIYNKKDSDVVLDNSSVNANIVIGPASTGGLSADYGGIGANPHSKGTSNIILQCGLGGRQNNGEGLPDGEITDTNLLGTDSVIYLSTMTDIDTALSCADGPIGNVKAGSGIGMYTDSIRMRAVCGGVKIITGPDATISTGDSGINNSMGGKCERASPIMLNAGNQDGNLRLTQLIEIPSLKTPAEEIPRLQGVVKGTNMVLCVQELSNILEQIIATVNRMALMLAINDTAKTAAEIALPFGGIAALPAISGLFTTHTFSDFVGTTIALRQQKVEWEQNFTLNENGVQGSKYIASVNVFTT